MWRLALDGRWRRSMGSALASSGNERVFVYFMCMCVYECVEHASDKSACRVQSGLSLRLGSLQLFKFKFTGLG